MSPSHGDINVLLEFYGELIKEIEDTTDVDIFLSRKERRALTAADAVTLTKTSDKTEVTSTSPNEITPDNLSALEKLDIHRKTHRGKKPSIDFDRPILTILKTEKGLTLQQITEKIKVFKDMHKIDASNLSKYVDSHLRSLLKWNLIRRTLEDKKWVYYLHEHDHHV